MAVLLLTASAAAFGWLAWKCTRDPQINFLPHGARSHWIIFPTPLDARAHPVAMIDATFRRTFTLDSQPKSAQLQFRAAKRVELKINGEAVPISPVRNWKELATIDVQNLLRSGENKIEARVFNDDAPAALWLHLDAGASSLRTDGSWEASIAGSSWRNCVVASVPRRPGPGNPLAGGEKVSDALPTVWRAWIAFAIVGFASAIGLQRWIKTDDVDLSRSKVLLLIGICVAAWLVLFWNNSKLLPFRVGYDSTDHVAYIKYIQEHRALPLPNEGYEMFQPPLFYALSAGVLSMCRLSVGDTAAVHVLRAMTMLFGIANFIFVFLSMRLLFPRHAAAQTVGLITAAFLPMQLYLAHYVTNETLAATLSTISIYLALRVLKTDRPSMIELLALGVAVGAAMLAKATSLLLIPPLLGALVIQLWHQRAPLVAWFRTVGSTIAAILLICGWHYIRIWRHFGKPIVGNWEPLAGFPIWQDPGFHTASDYFRFGQSLVAPLFSGFNSFADGLYSTLWGEGLGGGLSDMLSRTPWNYNLVVSGYLLALVPTALIIVGLAAATNRFIRQPSAKWFLLIGFSAAIFVALIFMTLRVPSYAQVKAFYGLSAIVPLCAFIAIAWEKFARASRVLRFALASLLVAFALNSFFSVWIQDSAILHIYAGRQFIRANRLDAAASEGAEAVRKDPANSTAQCFLGAVLDETGHRAEANEHTQRGLELDPADEHCQIQQAIHLAKSGGVEQAMTVAQRLIAAAPENPQAYDVLFTCARELQRTREAIAIGRDALAVSPFDAQLHYRTGLAAGEIGDLTTATQQLAYAVILDPRKTEHEQKFRVALSFLAQSADAAQVIRDLQPLAASSPKLLEILAAYRQNSNSTPQDRQ
jgi:tetratricopeptide (TPR) repeat protein